MNLSTLCAILVAFGPETSEFMMLTIAPFAAIRQKSAYHAKYLRISWTYLDLLHRLGRLLVAMIIQIFVWSSPKGRCYGNQLNMGGVRKRRVDWPLLFSSAFDNGLYDRKSAFKKINSSNGATSHPNLVHFRKTISEFLLLKRTIFAVIRPQFDDDLHSSRCFQNVLEYHNFDFSHFCTSCRNLVQWLWSKTHEVVQLASNFFLRWLQVRSVGGGDC